MVPFGFISCAVSCPCGSSIEFPQAGGTSQQDGQTERGAELLPLEEWWRWDGIWDDSLGDLAPLLQPRVKADKRLQGGNSLKRPAPLKGSSPPYPKSSRCRSVWTLFPLEVAPPGTAAFPPTAAHCPDLAGLRQGWSCAPAGMAGWLPWVMAVEPRRFGSLPGVITHPRRRANARQ